MMKHLQLGSFIAAFATAPLLAFSANPETLQALGEVNALQDKVKAYSADLEVRDKQAGQENVTTSSLLVSKEHGWKVRSSTPEGEYEFVSDFNTFYQYYPAEKKAVKHSADRPDASALFRKPVTDMNPVSLLDPASLVLKGKETINGEPVFHFEGTTSTQFLPQGRPVTRTLQAWISTQDGLPRKTVETFGEAEGTTMYKNVQLNPQVGPADFQFVPPPGVELIDMAAQARQMQAAKQAPVEAAGATTAPATMAPREQNRP